jgi:hypothetical protein
MLFVGEAGEAAAQARHPAQHRTARPPLAPHGQSGPVAAKATAPHTCNGNVDAHAPYS